MNRPLIVAAALLLLSTALAAQTQPAKGAPAQGAQAAQATPPAPPALKGVKTPPQAKSTEEFNAYLSDIQMPDLNAAEVAAQQFAAKYPQSELTSGLFLRLMFDNLQANNADKAIDMGRQTLKFEPTNPVAEIYVATLLAETTRDSDIDASQKFDEAVKDANAGLQNIETSLMIAGNMTQEQVEEQRTDLKARAYDALGLVSLKKKDNTTAEKELRQSVQVRGEPGDPMTHLRLALALDNQKRYADALAEANKAAALAPPGQSVAKLAETEVDRLKKLTNTAAAPTPTTQAPTTPK
jgi:tetratricopeptide (TPR) repeat protein